MARTNLYLPYEVRESIRTHFTHACERALDAFDSASEEEDTLTGHFFGLLKIKNQYVEVKQNELAGKGAWKWEIDYSKFRGRGIDATEKQLGADGILTVKLDQAGQKTQKSILFQSKLKWESSDDIVKQAIRLSTWREASFVLNYEIDRFEAIALDDAIKSKGKKANIRSYYPLPEYLSDVFLACKVGDTDLAYDASRRQLSWRNMNGQLVHTKFSIPNRLMIKISTPNSAMTSNNVKMSEIHNHRMQASSEEILSLPNTGFTKHEFTKAKRAMAQTYHTDLFPGFEVFEKELLKRRSQEGNAASEDIADRFK